MISNIIKFIFKVLVDLFKFIFGLLFKTKKKQNRKNLDIHHKEWVEINNDSKSTSPAVLKHTLVRADKSLDNVLKEVTKGNTMGERLISGKHLFSENTYQEIWSAHKIRNSMVHETGFEPPVYVLTRAINQLKKGVKELGVKAWINII